MVEKYLAFLRLGNKGRLANSIFEICSTIGLAKKHNRIPVFNHWPYLKYFQGSLNPIPNGVKFETVKEKYFHHHEWNFDDDKNYELDAYLQSEKYFTWYEDEIRELLTFKPEFLEATKAKMPKEVWDKETILFQIRRGDYVNNICYYQISITYYIDALITHFPNFQDYNIIFFSDELSYCHIHFDCLKNAYFTDGLSDIEQIAIGSLCDHFIIANSSFGWWQTWLGEKPTSKIIHCGHLHSGKLQEKSEPKDYYPSRWQRHQKDNYKIDLSDTTFTLPVFMDSQDRKANLDLTVCMLQKNFNTNIIVGEQGGNKFQYMEQYCKYMNFDLPHFHRTKMLNDMAIAANTPYIANWDADVIVPPMQVYLAVEELRQGSDMVFPYDGRFARLPRKDWFKPIEKLLDIGAIGDTEPKGKRGRPVPEQSVGGAVFFNKESFIDGGMENEYMVSFGPEDCERNDRFTKLGFKISPQEERIGGCLYHIDHWCGADSSTRNPFFKQNHAELEKIRAMSADELRLYIDTWKWRHIYTEAYYHRIVEGSIRSAKEVYKALDKICVVHDRVVDIGCGLGEWSCGNENYCGVDHNVSKKLLMIDDFYDRDLEKEEIYSTEKFDLCLCLETLEHISEERADILIQMLCKLSDTVLFSAAIPYQGGTGHVNEQWQSWWAKKFANNGFFISLDQPDIRFNKNIEMWYRQNIVLYVKNERMPLEYNGNTDFVLPEYYEQIVQHFKNQVK